MTHGAGSEPEPSGGIAGARGRRVAWTVVDQALASATNVGTAVVAARGLSPTEFGAFGLAFAVYLLALGVCRALVTEPLLTRHSHLGWAALRSGAREAAGASVVLGLVAGAGVAAGGWAVGGPSGAALLVLAPLLPGLLLQDAWRYCFVAAGRPRAAVANDAAWCAGLALTLPLVTGDQLSVGTTVLWWGGTGVAAAVVGCAQRAAPPRLWSARSWIRDHRDLGGRYAAEFVTATGATQSALLALGALGGLGAVGAVRAAQVFFGPINVLFGGMFLALVPEGVRLLGEPRRLRRLMVIGSLALMGIAAAWLVVGRELPASWGRALFGATWDGSHDLLVPVGAAVVAGGAAAGAIAGLRALGAASASLRARLLGLPLAVGLPVAGALRGAEEFALGVAAATTGGAFIWWYQFGRALREGPVAAAAPAETAAVRPSGPRRAPRRRLAASAASVLVPTGIGVTAGALLVFRPWVLVGAAGAAVAAVTGRFVLRQGRVVAAFAWAGVAFTAPFNGVRLTSFIALSDVFLLVAFAATVVSLVPRPAALPRPPSGVLLGLALIAVGGLIGTLAAEDPLASIVEVSKFFVAAAGSVVAMLLWRPTPRMVRWFCSLWLAGAVVSSLWALTFSGRVSGRPLGLSTHPNHLGIVCLLAVAMSLGFVLSGRRPLNWLSLASVPILVVALVASGSRAALLGLFVAVPAIALFASRVTLAVRALTLGAVLAVAVVAGLVSVPADTGLDRLFGAASAPASDESRVEHLLRSIRRFERHPLTGEGFEFAQEAHNIYLQVLVAAGPLGLIGLGLAASSVLGISRRGVRTGPGRVTGDRALLAGMAGGYAGYLVTGLFQNILWDRYLWLYLAATLALAGALAAGSSDEVSDREGRGSRSRRPVRPLVASPAGGPGANPTSRGTGWTR